LHTIALFRGGKKYIHVFPYSGEIILRPLDAGEYSGTDSEADVIPLPTINAQSSGIPDDVVG